MIETTPTLAVIVLFSAITFITLVYSIRDGVKYMIWKYKQGRNSN